MKSKSQPMIKVVFDLVMKPHEIPLFKTEILHLQDPKKDIWHNHVSNPEDMDFEKGIQVRTGRIIGKNYERYPMIQYRTELVNKRYHACLWGVGPGCDEIRGFLKGKDHILIGKAPDLFRVNVIELQEDWFDEFKVLPGMQFRKYSLTHFLPFNEDRYKEFKTKFFFVDKLELIERMACHNLRLFIHDFFPDTPGTEKLTVKALDLKGFHTAKYRPKDDSDTLTYVSVDMHIGINAVIPAEISIGNLKSLGYGILRPLKK